MKIIKLLLISIAVITLVIVYFERGAVFNFVKELHIPHRRLNPPKENMKKVEEYSPEELLDQAKPGIEGQSRYRLVKELEIESGNNGTYKFSHLLDVDTDVFGDLYLLDSERSGIFVFSKEGIYLRSFYIKEALVYSSVSLSVSSENIIAVADKQKHKIYLISDYGELLESFSLPFEPIQVRAVTDEYVVLGVYDHFLLHRYSKKGKMLAETYPLVTENETEQDIMTGNRSRIDIDFNNNIFLSYAYRYKIVKSDYEGIPQVVFSRDISREIPDSLSGGRTGTERIISLGIAVDSDGYVYNLLKGINTDGGDRIDKFDNKGNYLQTFFLEEPVSSFVLYRNETIWCLTSNNRNRIIKYRIEEAAAG